MEPKYYTNERSQQIVLSVLKAHGIRKVIASPGTTNVTLVGSMQNDPWFEMYSSVDERSAAYLACGLAAESGEAVVLTCTGATASRNYLPGLTEAYYRKLPVLAITASQGKTNVGHLVPQNIDRTGCLADVVKMSVQIEKTHDDPEEEWYHTILANKAVLELFHHGGGPVHINLATTYSKDFSVEELPYTQIIRRYMSYDEFPKIPEGKIAVFVGAHKLFTEQETEAIDAFCSTHDAIVITDHTSGYHGKFGVNFSIIGAQRKFRSPLRDFKLLIHIGEVSGDYYGCNIAPEEVWRVSEDGELRDRYMKLSSVFEMPEKEFFKKYSEDGMHHNEKLMEYRSQYEEYMKHVPELPFSNAWIASQMADKLPEHSSIHFGILNSLRSWNWYNLPDSVTSYSNVGGFGIDGDVSSMIGASLVNPEQLYFVVLGDLAFFYDMNVVGNKHVGNNVRILLVNNGRGSEFRLFSHPCYQWGKRADEYMAAAGHYGNQSPNLVKDYAGNLGYEYLTAASKEEFLNVYQRFVTPELVEKPMIFEVFTEPEAESKALELITSCIEKPANDAMKEGIKEAINSIVPQNILSFAKKIIK